MNTNSTYFSKIQDVEIRALDELREIADEIFRNEVIPFCDKYNCEFLSGNNDFFFYRPGERVGNRKFEDEDSEKENEDWQKLHALLMREVFLLRDNSIGTFMDCYTPEGFKR